MIQRNNHLFKENKEVIRKWLFKNKITNPNEIVKCFAWWSRQANFRHFKRWHLVRPDEIKVSKKSLDVYIREQLMTGERGNTPIDYSIYPVDFRILDKVEYENLSLHLPKSMEEVMYWGFYFYNCHSNLSLALCDYSMEKFKGGGLSMEVIIFESGKPVGFICLQNFLYSYLENKLADQLVGTFNNILLEKNDSLNLKIKEVIKHKFFKTD